MAIPSKSEKAHGSVVIRQTVEPDDIAAVRKCFEVFIKALDFDISYLNFAAELNDLPRQYLPPSAALLLARDSETGESLGCIAMQPVQIEPRYLGQRAPDARCCELKRMFVYPEARRKQVARYLVQELVALAKAGGYHEMLLETMPYFLPAVNLYRSEGFQETNQFTTNPNQGVLRLSKKLV